MEPIDEDILHCDLCHQKYNHYTRRPKLLVCHHSYCLKCLQSLQTVHKVVVCLACQKDTKIGPTGVTALPDNTFVLERLENVPEEDEVLLNKGEIMSPINLKHEGDHSRSSALSSNASEINEGALNGKPEVYCQVCQKAAVPSCIGMHTLTKFEYAVHEMENELAKERKAAMSSLERVVENAEQLSTLTAYIQDAWSALKIILDHNQKEYNDKIKEAQDLMQNLKASKCGVEEARNGNTLLLQHTINKFKELSQDISYKARNFEETICQWKVVTNCTAQIKLHEKTPSFPLDNFDINLDLHDSSQSSECICLMFALSRYVEKRLQTKRLDNLVGNENAWGSHTLEDIATNGEHAKSLGEASPPYKSEKNNNMENGYQLQVVDSSKSKATIAQIVATKPVQPALGQQAAKPVSLPKPMPPQKYPATVHCFFDLQCDNKDLGRVVMDIYYSKAPVMSRNFIELCTGIHGIGYKFTDLWNVPDSDHVVGGHLRDAEKQSIYNRKPFFGDSSPMHDEVGMLRMRGHGTAEDGRAIVSSQFMIWMKPKQFKHYIRTLVFGKVVKGMEVLALVPTMINKKDKQDLSKRVPPCRIINCGLLT